MTTLTDINDAIKEGFSLDDLENVAIPMDYTKHAPEMAIAALEDALEQLENQSVTQRSGTITNLFKKKKDLTEAWLKYEDDMEVLRLKIKGHRGAGTTVDTLFRAIRKSVKKRGKVRKKQIKQDHDAIMQYRSNGGDEPDPDVLNMLERKAIKEGGEFVGWAEPLPKIHNLDCIFREDPRISGKLRFNVFSHTAEYNGEPLTDYVVDKMRLWVSKTYYGMDLRSDTGRVMHLVCKDNSYHPVREWMENLPDWDGRRRVDHLWTTYFGAKDSILHRAFARCFMVGMVARQYVPGAKLDTMPVLIGPTGIGKSKGLRLLAIKDKWFNDSTFDLSSKDAYLAIQGMLIYELAEVEHIFNRAGHSRCKAFMSSRIDRFRAPYHAHMESVPRVGVFAASTNSENLGFLADPTSSRRYHPLKVFWVDLRLLEEDLEQLWAEAKALYLDPKTRQWWLPPRLERQREKLASQYAQQDPWAEIIIRHFEDIMRTTSRKSVKFTAREILINAIGFKQENIGVRQFKRCTDILVRVGCFKDPDTPESKKHARKWVYAEKVELDIDDD